MKRFIRFAALMVIISMGAAAQDRIVPGATEETPSRAQYFSWINNTNEGATEAQTLINLEFFGWLQREYGMRLDIYAFDAGAIDGKRFYGKTSSDRFMSQFPNGFDPVVHRAGELGMRLGVWGGPDGFGDTPGEERARIEQMVGLCRDYNFALFKFDAVCGPLRPEKEDAFIEMMTRCREFSPDLILLNHRLGLERAAAYATTFLWEGSETYIDVFMSNGITAPHHRAGAISRGVPPDLLRLTEDHGVCLSSCLDYWDDDLILQAFNRSLILAPQIYGNPWLLRDDEFPKLARIYNLHRKYRDILVKGKVLPENRCGPHAVSRGDGSTRLITLRNLTWEKVEYTLDLGEEIGLRGPGEVEVRRYHPEERVIGRFPFGSRVKVDVPPFRSCLIITSTGSIDEPAVTGADFRVIRNVEGRPVAIDILGRPGTSSEIALVSPEKYKKALLGGRDSGALKAGRPVVVDFPGKPLRRDFPRKVSGDWRDLDPTAVDWRPFYEATAFCADSNALEVRSLQRSGWSSVPEVRAAQDAFFNQKTFIDRGVWDRNLFDGSFETGFWPSKKYNRDQRVKGGCLRLDLGGVTDIDRLLIHTGDIFSLQPLLEAEGNIVEVSRDLLEWTSLTYLAGKSMTVEIGDPVRYLRFKAFPSRIVEIEGFRGGRPLDRGLWRASNLLAHPDRLECRRLMRTAFTLDEIAPGSYLCVALEGDHGVEGAYAAAMVDGRLLGAPDRARSFPSNTWEYVNRRAEGNSTYYIPLDESKVGREIEVFVMAFDEGRLDFKPVVWIAARSKPCQIISLILEREPRP